MSDNKEVRKLSDVLKDENIIDTERFHENVDFVFSKIAKSVSKTLGPGGGYTIITNIETQAPVYPTKDGYTVVQEYKFNDQIKYFISEIIKDIPKRMNVNVGDSTTSGLIIAYELYKYLKEFDIIKDIPEIGCTLPPISLRIILNSIREVLMEEISKNPEYIQKDLERDQENKLMKRVAITAANNDPEIGEMVADLFINRDSNHVFVTAEMNTEDETFVDKEVGFQFGSGFIHPVMSNQVDRITCKLECPKFLLVDGPLTLNDLSTLHMIIDYVILDLKRPIVIVAKDFDQPVRNMLVERCSRTTIMKNGVPVLHEKEPLAALQINTEHEKSRDRLEDLRILLGCEIVETKKGKMMKFKNTADFIDQFLGEADEISGTQISTRVKRGKGDKAAILERIKHIENRIKEIDRNEGILAFSSIDNHRRRIAMMNSDMTIIKVGGANDKERRARKLIFDDAILACSSAMDHGFSLGGSVNICHYINSKYDNLVKLVTDKLISGSRHIVIGNKEEDITKIVSRILQFVNLSFSEAYKVAVENMVGEGSPKYKEIVDIVYPNVSGDKPVIFDLVRGRVNSLTDEDSCVIVPANTDFELLTAIFGSVGTLISSNQLLSVYPGDFMLYGVGQKK